MTEGVLQTALSDYPVRRGKVRDIKVRDIKVRDIKVRDIYDPGDQLLLVSTDRISAFDWVLPTVTDTGNTDTGNTAWC